MIRDQLPTQRLGFGINPADVPIRSDSDGRVDRGPRPNNGAISNALNGHPIGRFLAVSAASAIAMGVASKLIKSGGVRLGEELFRGAQEERSWQAGLLSHFRSLQKTLDEFEGIGRKTDEAGRTLSTFKRAGFWQSEAEKARALEHEVSGKFGKTPHEWALRDELQQRLVHKARALPYELPAIYVAGKVTRRVTGSNDANNRVKWYNPIDVVGDFAQQSVKNTISMLMPWEIGGASMKHGWRRLMTYGDTVSTTQPFQGRIRNTSISLQSILSQFGHSASQILAAGVQKSTQASGAFGSAVQESMSAPPPRGFLWSGRIRDAKRGFKEEGAKGALKKAVPNVNRFVQTFREHWNDDLEREPSIIEQYAGALKVLEPRQRGLRLGGDFAATRERSEYLKTLSQELLDASKLQKPKARADYAKSVEAFINRATLRRMPYYNSRLGILDPREEMMSRIGLGRQNIQESLARGEAPWEEQFGERLKTLGIPDKHQRWLQHDMQDAIQRTDATFLNKDFRTKLDARIKNEYQDIYERVVVPTIRGHFKTVPFASEDIHRTMSPDVREAMERRLATKLKFNTKGISTSVLHKQMQEAGLDLSDYHGLRAHLIEEGIVAKPWQIRGFNALGLKPLTVDKALDKKFFPSELEGKIRQINTDISDPYSKGYSGRRVGKGIYETASGDILDLSKLANIASRTSDALARHLQVPFLHFSPFDLFAHSARKAMSRSPIIQMQSSIGYNFAAEARNTDTNVFIRNRGSKGQLFGHTLGKDISFIPGLFKSAPTGGEGMIARSIRYAAGDTGFYKEPEAGLKGKLKQKFAIGPNQRGSLFEFFGALRKGEISGHPDIKDNAAAFSRDLLTNGVPDDITLDYLKGAKHLQSEINSKFSLSSGVARNLLEADPENKKLAALLKIPEYDAEGNVVREVPLHSIRRAKDFYDLTQGMMDHDLAHAENLTAGGDAPENLRRNIASAQGFIRKIFLDKRYGSVLLDEPSPRNMSSSGMHRRMDEMRADVYQYLVAREEAVRGGGNEAITELLDALDKLKADPGKNPFKNPGRIGDQEYIETRAAILGMQFNIESIKAHQIPMPEALRVQQILRNVVSDPHAQRTLEDVASYKTRYTHKGGFFGLQRNITRSIAAGGNEHTIRGRTFRRRGLGMGTPSFDGVMTSPYGGNQNQVFVPTFGSQLKQRPWRAIKNVIGATTKTDPEAFSTSSIGITHLFHRLNRYFQMVGLGVDENKFNPLGFFAKGLVGRRVLPAVVGGSVLMAADRTIGHRDGQYKPALTGIVATGLAHARVAFTPGKERREAKREEYFGDKDVAIRKGRYWPLGSSNYRGSKVMYFRPNWYKRFMSGYKYTDEGVGSPLEDLAFNKDYSPLRPFSPYHFEKKHYQDRPYPVSGQYFTGPWGPLTTALNLTVGRLIKPTKLMHTKEMDRALGNMQQMGQGGMVTPAPINYSPKVITRNPTGSAALFQTQTAGSILGMQDQLSLAAPSGDYPSAYNQPYGFMGQEYGTSPQDAIESYRSKKHLALHGGSNDYRGLGLTTGGSSGSITKAASGNAVSNEMLANVNRTYESMAHTPRKSRKDIPMMYSGDPNQSHFTGNNPYNRIVMASPRVFDPRIVAKQNPINPGSTKYQLGQLGYESQEMFGIYGWAFGAIREKLGLGSHDYHPRGPVLQSADRAYGSERAFWDLNLGGLGDFPSIGDGEYGNIEASEIVRRFIPHRRREITEINPLENQLGKEYKFLPHDDYFIDFHTGDPRSKIPEGELRLPGKGYEYTHKLHSDVTGKYGILDKYAILADIAPYSKEYKAINKVVKKMNLNPEDKKFAISVRKEVSAQNKRKTFSPYRYANTNFIQGQAKVTGFLPGEADKLITDQGIIQFAGARAKAKPEAMEWLQSYVQPGDVLNVRYDANYPPKKDQPIDVIAQTQKGINLNRALLDQDFGYESKKNMPLDFRVREGAAKFKIHAALEKVSHFNTLITNKLGGKRTAVEDWERTNVYGSSFPRWESPIRSFIKPLSYRAMNRNPLLAAVALGGAGELFGRTKEAKYVGGIIGAVAGFGLAFHSDAKSFQTGERFIPRDVKKAGAIEENIDILNYVKYSKLYSQARQQALQKEGRDPEELAREVEEGVYKKHQLTNIGPNTAAAMEYRRKMQTTEYGADLHGDVMNLAGAIPKRKRDHFLEFLSAPVSDRARILSTAPRLERRIYESRWGMKVEQRPDLTGYFQEHELPGPDWEGWGNTNLETVKLKMVNHAGLDASQMGYYPQQVNEANLVNMSYPDFNKKSSRKDVQGQLQALLNAQGISGNVRAIPTYKSGTSVQLYGGVNG